MTLNPNRKTRLILIALLLTAAITGTILFLTFSVFSNSPGFQPDEPGSASNLEEKLLLTEFGDFQCSHCARFALILLPALERDLIKPGTVRFEYRHYPFLGPESFSAAEASECARDQKKFREYHDKLFTLTAQGKKLTPENLTKIAKGLKLDPARFDRCMKNGEKQAQVLGDREYGNNLGVRGTPALFMEGQELRWQNYSNLQQQILEQAESRKSKETPASPGTQQEAPQP